MGSFEFNAEAMIVCAGGRGMFAAILRGVFAVSDPQGNVEERNGESELDGVDLVSDTRKSEKFFGDKSGSSSPKLLGFWIESSLGGSISKPIPDDKLEEASE